MVFNFSCESTKYCILDKVNLFILQIYWSDNGDLVCIATSESYFILKYDQEKVVEAQDNKELVTEDGIEDTFNVSVDTTLLIIWNRHITLFSK